MYIPKSGDCSIYSIYPVKIFKKLNACPAMLLHFKFGVNACVIPIHAILLLPTSLIKLQGHSLDFESEEAIMPVHKFYGETFMLIIYRDGVRVSCFLFPRSLIAFAPSYMQLFPFETLIHLFLY